MGKYFRFEYITFWAVVLMTLLLVRGCLDEAEADEMNFEKMCGHERAELRSYPVTLRRVVDGDTQDVEVDLGFNIVLQERLRLIGVDTPEKYGDSKEAGLKATEFSRKWWEKNSGKVTIRAAGFGKFGRPLVYVEGAGQALNAELIKSGNALYYCGGKKAK